MRRALYLLAAMLVGAVSTASAQARLELSARRDSTGSNPNDLLVQVRGLLDDPVWLKELQDAYTIQMHWSVQLWRKQNFIRSELQSRTEWDAEIHAIPALKQYVYIDRVPRRPDAPHVFPTLDELKAWLRLEIRLPGSRTLNAGDWYYQVDVSLSRLTQEQIDRRTSGGGSGGVGELLRNWMIGSGPSWDQRVRIPFVVTKK